MRQVMLHSFEMVLHEELQTSSNDTAVLSSTDAFVHRLTRHLTRAAKFRGGGVANF